MEPQGKSQPGGGQGRSRPKAKDQAGRQPQSQPKARARQPEPGGSKAADKTATKQEVEVISDTVTAGQNGETHITVEWYWQWVNGSHPCGWKIGTLEGHDLDVCVDIHNYTKQHSGTTRIDTGLCPIHMIPIGSRGTVDITDTHTGEKRVVEFGVYLLPGPLGKLWKLLKKLFTNKKD